MDLSTLNTARLDEEGAVFIPRHPDSPYGKLDIEILLRSSNCATVRAKSRAFMTALQTDPDYKKTGAMDSEQIERHGTETLVACTVGWKNVMIGGKEFAYSPANARSIWGDPGWAWLRQQAQAFIAEAANFLPKDAPASTPTLSASSSLPARSTEQSPEKAA